MYCMKGGVATHQCSYACQVLGAGHIQGACFEPGLIKKHKLKELYGMGRVGLDQHTSTIFNPRPNQKKHPFGTVQSLKHVGKGTLTIDHNQQLLHTITSAFSAFKFPKTTFMYNECAA